MPNVCYTFIIYNFYAFEMERNVEKQCKFYIAVTIFR